MWIYGVVSAWQTPILLSPSAMPFRYLTAALAALLLAPAALAQPDLSISATAEDASGDAGGRVTLDYTVTLTGAEEIEDVSVGFYFSTDQTLSSDDVLSEREEVDAESDEPESDNEQIDIPNSLDDGDYFILVVIDDLEQVTESDETNNTEAIAFTVGNSGGSGGGGSANLIVTSVSAEPSSAAPGDEVEGEYDLANTGSEAAGESSVAFYLSTNATLSTNDTFLAREDADGVDAGGDGDGDFEFTVPSGLAAGDYFLLAVADDRNDVTESDESDNVASTPFTVTGGGSGGGGGDADLIVTAVSVEPATGQAGDEIEGEYDLANTGSEASGESQVGVYLSDDASLSSNDVLLTREDADGVDAGGDGDGDFEFTVPGSVEPGDYFIIVAADDGNAVPESAENNNTEATPFTVTGSGGGGSGGGEADLRVTAASVQPTSADPGSEIELSYTVANTGSAEAGETQLGVYVSTDQALSSGDALVTRIDIDGVDADGDTDGDEDVTVPNDLAAGDYFLLFVADDRNTVSESRESNNVRAVPFTVTGPGGGSDGDADLRISEAEVEPGSAEAGANAEVGYTVANTGDGDAGASTVAVYLSTDNSLSSSDTRLASETASTLAAGNDEDGELTVTIPDGTAPGDYFLLVVADDGNDVAEQRESNNVRALAFTVDTGTAGEDAPTDALDLAAAPNPVAGTARVAFTVAAAGPVRLAVVDLLGREVAVLADGPAAAGAHSVAWDASALAPGVYVLRLGTADDAVTQTVTVVR